MELKCTIVCFESNGFTWFKDNEVLETGYTNSYNVTNSVTVKEVGGQKYSCLCESSNIKQCFFLLGAFNNIQYTVSFHWLPFLLYCMHIIILICVIIYVI